MVSSPFGGFGSAVGAPKSEQQLAFSLTSAMARSFRGPRSTDDSSSRVVLCLLSGGAVHVHQAVEIQKRSASKEESINSRAITGEEKKKISAVWLRSC